MAGGRQTRSTDASNTATASAPCRFDFGDKTKESLAPGIKHVHRFKVPVTKTVPALYPEATEFGKKLTFKVEAHDGVDLISRGVHERFVINKQKFDARIGANASSAQAR